MQEALTKAEEQKRNDFKAGRSIGLSGREMFSFDPALAAEDDDDDDETFDLRNLRPSEEGEEQEVEYRDIQLDLIGMEASEVSIFFQSHIILFKIRSYVSFFESQIFYSIYHQFTKGNASNLRRTGETQSYFFA